MIIETERKFLVRSDWHPDGEGSFITQGYLTGGVGEPTVRVRIRDDKAFLTIKGMTVGISRPEFEYAIPVSDAEELLNTLAAQRVVTKKRYEIPYGEHLWEVDVFEGDNEGLVLAEVELQSPDEAFEKPGWVSEEVSGDMRYSNRYLAGRPYLMWTTKA